MAIDFGGAVIGVLDSADLAGRDFSGCLCEEEREAGSHLRNSRRREEWLAARILAKYLFLDVSGTGLPACPAWAGRPGPRLFRMNGHTLSGIAPERFREISVAGGPPHITWHDRSEAIAISHTNGIACAAVTRGTIDALDMETRAARVAPFYEQNFTPRERQWADGCCRAHGMDRDWVYALLWSMKECILKTPSFAHLSIWNMRSMEVVVRAGTSALGGLDGDGELRDEFVYLETEVNDGYRVVPAWMAVAGTRDLVLTASKTISEREL
jgi:phosphopantetheinyl transferase